MAQQGEVAVVGGGVIGGGWVARFLEHGYDVALYDPAPAAMARLQVVLDNAEHAYRKLTMAPAGQRGRLRQAETLEDAVKDAWYITEAVPERLDIKQTVYATIESAAPDDALIASSTSGILPSDLQAKMRLPGRLMVAHPFNPVYLLPLVELCGGAQTDTENLEKAAEFLAKLGMKPLTLRKEIDAFIADRLLEAVWRESLWLIKDDICTTEELDDAIRFGFGLRWAQMGLFETYRIAGGEAGMKHFLAQFGPTLSWPWTKLMDVPDLDDALSDKIASQSDDQARGRSIAELERIRDDNLVAIMQALRGNNWGAGATLAAHEKRLYDKALTPTVEVDIEQPIPTISRTVPTDWADYNGHMNESRYLQFFSDASDALMRLIGVDTAYVEQTGSYFTAESHICHLGEAHAQDPVIVTTQVLSGAGKKMHLFHRLSHADGTPLATAEQMLIHVSLETRRATEPGANVARKLGEIADAHAKLDPPEQQGRAIGQRR